MSDGRVIVIGGGAAAVWAAVSARRAGAHVTLLRQSPGASAISSGCLDLAAGSDLEGLPAAPDRAAAAFARAHREHPFAAIGASLPREVERARALVTEAHPRLQFRGAQGRNLLLATPLGTLKEAWLAQGAIARGDLCAFPRDARLGVVGLANRTAFDAQAAAAGLRERGHDAVAVSVEFPIHALCAVTELAKALDEAPLRAKFIAAAAAAAQAAGATHLLLPTAGYDDPSGLLDALTPSVVQAAELPGLPPSVPGLRLDRDLERLAKECATLAIAAVREASVAGGRVRSVRTDDGQVWEADAFVLATGRFLGGGIRHEGAFRETVFGLPVFAGGQDAGDRWLGDLLDRDPVAVQAALAAGVAVNGSMQPVDRPGRAVLSNLFAAGGVIGGYDPAKEGGGLGVAAVTAVIAGNAAAAAARENEDGWQAPGNDAARESRP